MTQQEYTKHDSVRQYPLPGQQENPDVGPETDLGPERGEEVSLRIERPGYGGAPLSAVVPAGTLSEIEMGDRPVETDLKIRVPGYGWRVVGVRVSPRDEEDAQSKTRSVRMRVPGYGRAPFKLAFPGRTRWCTS